MRTTYATQAAAMRIGHAYNAGDTCHINVIFAPSAVGYRQGAVVLYDGSNRIAAVRYIGVRYGSNGGAQSRGAEQPWRI